MLELLAFAIHVILLGPLVESLLTDEADTWVMLVDANSAVQVVLKGSAKSPTLQYTLNCMDDCPTYARLKNRLAIGHLFGEANVCADLASRGKISVLRQYYAQMQMRPNRISMNQEAMMLLKQVAAFANMNLANKN